MAPPFVLLTVPQQKVAKSRFVVSHHLGVLKYHIKHHTCVIHVLEHWWTLAIEANGFLEIYFMSCLRWTKCG